MKILERADIPLILSVILSFLVGVSDIEINYKIVISLLLLLLGVFLKSKVKEREFKTANDIIKDVKDFPEYVDIGSLKKRLPQQYHLFVNAMEFLLKRIQEYEVQKIELENMIKYANVEEVDRLRKELKTASDRIKKMEEKVSHLQIIYDITSKINSIIEAEDILDFVVKMIGEKLKVEKLAVLLKNENGDLLEVKALYGFPKNLRNMKFAPTEGISGLVFSTGEYIYVPDTARDRRYLHWKGEFVEYGSFLSIPIKFGGEIMGVLNFNKSGVASFSDEEIELLKRVADQLAIAIKNSNLLKQIKSMYGKDNLTGLLNRTRMMEEVQKVISMGQNFSFVLFDIDDFRDINLKYGYSFGDKVLVEVARILKEEFRRLDVISRFGGDEFAILISGASRGKAVREMEKITELIGQLGWENQVKISISGGISEFPEECKDAREIFEFADRKLLLAKKENKGKIIA